MIRSIAIILFILLFESDVLADKSRFTATPLTEENSFTEGVEGPACDNVGNVYAVNFGKQQTIGRVMPDGTASIFLELTGTSCGNGIRFGNDGSMFIADYKEHQILRIRPGSKKVEKFAGDHAIYQPNDLTITSSGTIFVSDPDWENGGGRIWRVSPQGECTIIADNLKLPNGIEISPDERTLYVAQTKAAEILAYTLSDDLQIQDQSLLIRFKDHLIDGIRCGKNGDIFAARYGSGKLAVVSPAGQLLYEIDVLGNAPSNLCFSPDGKTVYVTEVEKRRLVKVKLE